MKTYRTYRNIRKRALIMGLPLSMFALQLVVVIGSLLIIIFSFHLGVIVGLSLFNALLYGALGRWVKKPFPVKLHNTFPGTIRNKRPSLLFHV